MRGVIGHAFRLSGREKLMNEVHEGGCVCGAVRYRVRGEPVVGMACHCRFCQQRLGTAFALVAYFEVRPGLRSIAAGTFDDPDWIRIERHIWARSKRPWVSVPADVTVFPQGSAGAPAAKAL